MTRDIWTDEEILHRLRASDVKALDALMVRFYRPLVNFVLGYVGDTDTAEDVLQELFIRLWERRATLQPATTLQAYLYTAARNAALNANARCMTQGRYEAESALRRPDAGFVFPQGTDRLEEAELARILEQAVASLSERSREVYILGMQHGLTYREIATTLGIAIPTAQTHMTRALKALEEALRPFLVLALLLNR